MQTNQKDSGYWYFKWKNNIVFKLQHFLIYVYMYLDKGSKLSRPLFLHFLEKMTSQAIVEYFTLNHFTIQIQMVIPHTSTNGWWQEFSSDRDLKWLFL